MTTFKEKTMFRPFSISLFVVVLLFTACKKSEKTQPPKNTADPNLIALKFNEIYEEDGYQIKVYEVLDLRNICYDFPSYIKIHIAHGYNSLSDTTIFENSPCSDTIILDQIALRYDFVTDSINGRNYHHIKTLPFPDSLNPRPIPDTNFRFLFYKLSNQ